MEEKLVKASNDFEEICFQGEGRKSKCTGFYEVVRHKKASKGTCNQSGPKGHLVNKAYEWVHKTQSGPSDVRSSSP